MTETHIHTFTASGLGKAPFRFTSVDEKPDGCRHCGAAIRNRFHIVSADGVHSVVGSTCIEKTGDQGLIDIARAEKNRRARERAQAKRQVAIDAEFKAQRDRNGGLTDWEVTEATHKAEEAARREALKPVIDLADDLEDGRGGFRDSVARDLRNGFLPTPRAIEIIIEILGEPAAKAFATIRAA
jgi:hypothetical protein